MNPDKRKIWTASAVILYVGLTAVGSWALWTKLSQVRQELRMDIYSMTINTSRTVDLTSRYMADLERFIEKPDSADLPKQLRNIRVLKTRKGALETPFERINPDPEISSYFNQNVAQFVAALSEIETLLGTNPLTDEAKLKIEDQMFLIEDVTGGLYTKISEFIQQRANRMRDIQENLATITAVSLVGLMSLLGGMMILLGKFYAQKRLLQEQVLTDPLTGLHNRRYYDEVAELLFANASRSGGCFAQLQIDVDHFKLYNDTYGHDRGDAALQAIAKVLASVTQREADLAFRLGGEEFCCLLSTETQQDAMKIAERVRAAVESLGVEHRASTTADVLTVSIGMSAIPAPDIADHLALYKVADEALYQAKSKGRNRLSQA